MTLIFRLIIRRDIWIFHSKVFSSVLILVPKKLQEYFFNKINLLLPQPSLNNRLESTLPSVKKQIF